MKLKDDFVVYPSREDERLLVSISREKDAFRGLARSNETAAVIVDCLKEETSEEAIVDKLAAEYDAPRDQIAADVKEFLDKLRKIGALDS